MLMNRHTVSIGLPFRYGRVGHVRRHRRQRNALERSVAERRTAVRSINHDSHRFTYTAAKPEDFMNNFPANADTLLDFQCTPFSFKRITTKELVILENVQPPESSKVFILYEDFAFAVAATRACYSLETAGELIDRCDILWKIDLLRLETLREVAASDASRAQLVVLAISLTEKLPPLLRNFVQLWEKHARGRRQDVVIIECNPDAPEAVHDSGFGEILELAQRLSWRVRRIVTPS